MHGSNNEGISNKSESENRRPKQSVQVPHATNIRMLCYGKARCQVLRFLLQLCKLFRLGIGSDMRGRVGSMRGGLDLSLHIPCPAKCRLHQLCAIHWRNFISRGGIGFIPGYGPGYGDGWSVHLSPLNPSNVYGKVHWCQTTPCSSLEDWKD